MIDLQVVNAPVRSLDKQLDALFVNENQENEGTEATIEEFLGTTQIQIPQNGFWCFTIIGFFNIASTSNYEVDEIISK